MFVFTHSYGQDKFWIGGEGIYNMAVKSTGFGVRAEIKTAPQVCIVPSFRYMPANNDIHEFLTGLNVNWHLVKDALVRPYLSGGLLYNKWINAEEFNNSQSAQSTRLIPELGAGVQYGNNNVRAFAELKYNISWNESLIHFGILLNPGSLINTGRHTVCATYL